MNRNLTHESSKKQINVLLSVWVNEAVLNDSFRALSQVSKETSAPVTRVLFENKVPARRFAKTNVDQFSGRNMAITMERDGSSSDGEKLDVLRKEVV